MSYQSLPDDHVPDSVEVFLDSSIPISMRKGPLFRDRIRWLLARFEWKATCSYAKTEYGNVVLSKAVYALRQLKNRGSLDAVRDWAANVLNDAFHGAHRTWILNFFNQQFAGETDAERTEQATLWLSRTIKFGTRFVDAVADSPMKDGTGCYWAKQRAREHQGTLTWETPSCSRDLPRCRIHEFFVENRDKFMALKKRIDALPIEEKTDQLSNFAEVIGQANDDPECLLDYRSGCRLLADATIAVESAGCQSMFTMNVNESRVLAKELNQDLYLLPANPDNAPGTGIGFQKGGNAGSG